MPSTKPGPKAPSEPNVKVNIVMPLSMRQKLAQLAQDEGTSLSFIARRFIKHSLAGRSSGRYGG